MNDKNSMFSKKNLKKKPKSIFTAYRVQNPISIIDTDLKLNYYHWYGLLHVFNNFNIIFLKLDFKIKYDLYLFLVI
jgi:hypothetical protein